MKMLRLPHDKVVLGSPLPWNVRDTEGRLLLSIGHIVSSEEQLAALLQRGAFVDVEEIRAAAGLVSHGVAAPKPATNLFGKWDNTTSQLEGLVKDISKVTDFPDRMEQFARQIIELTDHDPDVGIYRTVRQEKVHLFHYGYIHSVHTALICILISRRLQWTENKAMSLVKAALTMNLTILDLQGQMAKQDVPMRDKQKAAIQKRKGFFELHTS